MSKILKKKIRVIAISAKNLLKGADQMPKNKLVSIYCNKHSQYKKAYFPQASKPKYICKQCQKDNCKKRRRELSLIQSIIDQDYINEGVNSLLEIQGDGNYFSRDKRLEYNDYE